MTHKLDLCRSYKKSCPTSRNPENPKNPRTGKIIKILLLMSESLFQMLSIHIRGSLKPVLGQSDLLNIFQKSPPGLYGMPMSCNPLYFKESRLCKKLNNTNMFGFVGLASPTFRWPNMMLHNFSRMPVSPEASRGLINFLIESMQKPGTLQWLLQKLIGCEATFATVIARTT